MIEHTAYLGDVSRDEFRAAAHEAVDWIADYLTEPGNHPVRSRVLIHLDFDPRSAAAVMP